MINKAKRIDVAKMAPVDRLLKSQWNKNATDHVAAKVGEKIWIKIADHCFPAPKRRVQGKMVALCAASILVAILISSIWFHRNNEEAKAEYQEIIAHEHCLHVLPDSSKVWMQPGCSLRYLKDFSQNRSIAVTGDATFEVVKHAGYPFRVYINRAFIEVKGTIFRVINSTGGVSKTILFEGYVDFHHGTMGEVVAMKPRQQITYSEDGSVKLDNICNVHWVNGRYKFTDTRLDSLVEMVNTMFDKKITLEKNFPTDYLFNGTVRFDERLSEVAEKICYNMHLKYRWDNGRITIYKNENN